LGVPEVAGCERLVELQLVLLREVQELGWVRVVVQVRIGGPGADPAQVVACMSVVGRTLEEECELWLLAWAGGRRPGTCSVVDPGVDQTEIAGMAVNALRSQFRKWVLFVRMALDVAIGQEVGAGDALQPAAETRIDQQRNSPGCQLQANEWP